MNIKWDTLELLLINICKLTAIEFIATVLTVRTTRTHQMSRNALIILASELVGTTNDFATIWNVFIITIWTVHTAVAQPTPMNACDTVVALIFWFGTSRHNTRHVFGAFAFVGAIWTVWITVTTPFRWDTGAIVAFEIQIRIALGRWTVLLVAVITAIIVAVASPTLLYAFAICTCEFVGTACFICKICKTPVIYM